MTDTPERRCTARSKRSGERCKRLPSIGRTTCAMHGGKTPVGRASRNFKHGRYSKYLPRDLQQRITAGLRDETLVSMRNELAVLDARAADLFAQCENGDIPAKVWQQWAGLVELRRKLADVELRRERFLSRHLTAEQAQALIGSLLVIINDEVSPDQAHQISARVSQTLLQQGIADVFVTPARPGDRQTPKLANVADADVVRG